MVKGFFKERINRFAALVNVKCEEVKCHLPNPGRLKELLKPGVEIHLEPASGKERKTLYTLKAICLNGFLVYIDSHEANKLFYKAVINGLISEFSNSSYISTEVKIGNSRIDFLLSRDNQKCFVEVKSCTLVQNGIAMFPDAPTSRGRKHLETLIHLRGCGHRTVVVFVVQRPDAALFKPNIKMDPAFTSSLRNAERNGVEIYSYKIKNKGYNLTKIPIEL